MRTAHGDVCADDCCGCAGVRKSEKCMRSLYTVGTRVGMHGHLGRSTSDASRAAWMVPPSCDKQGGSGTKFSGNGHAYLCEFSTVGTGSCCPFDCRYFHRGTRGIIPFSHQRTRCEHTVVLFHSLASPIRSATPIAHFCDLTLFRSFIGSSSVCLALVLTHLSCSAATVTCFQ